MILLIGFLLILILLFLPIIFLIIGMQIDFPSKEEKEHNELMWKSQEENQEILTKAYNKKFECLKNNNTGGKSNEN